MEIIRIFSYCLIYTHYHLSLQTPQGNLQRVMRHIGGVYTQRFNRAYKREGPLFRGRYKAILIDLNEYLAAVVRYIHLNPVKFPEGNLIYRVNPVEVKRADDPKDYPWSSHHHYLRHKKAQKGKRNEARQVAMYLIRELCKKSLKEIAQSFSLGSYGGVGGACSVIDR